MLSSFHSYAKFSAEHWSSLALGMDVNLSAEEIDSLRSLCDPIDIKEVEHIYLPLIKLLDIIIANYQDLYKQKAHFFQESKLTIPPFIIGIAGSVAVGKSTLARILQILLQRSKEKRIVELVTTDGFLYPNKILEQKNKLFRKGFPDSYDIQTLLKFLSAIKNRQDIIEFPLYSHVFYDVLEQKKELKNNAEIVIVEGVNVLQVYRLKKENKQIPLVSDFFDFSIYIDANSNNIEKWYVNRFLKLRETAFLEEGAYFKKYAELSIEESLAKARFLWKNINLKNLKENIAPSKRRANLIFFKGDNHLVETIMMRD